MDSSSCMYRTFSLPSPRPQTLLLFLFLPCEPGVCTVPFSCLRAPRFQGRSLSRARALLVRALAFASFSLNCLIFFFLIILCFFFLSFISHSVSYPCSSCGYDKGSNCRKKSKHGNLFHSPLFASGFLLWGLTEFGLLLFHFFFFFF